jgi:hypothetical protein
MDVVMRADSPSAAGAVLARLDDGLAGTPGGLRVLRAQELAQALQIAQRRRREPGLMGALLRRVPEASTVHLLKRRSVLSPIDIPDDVERRPPRAVQAQPMTSSRSRACSQARASA